jgi:hypothetical protein
MRLRTFLLFFFGGTNKQLYLETKSMSMSRFKILFSASCLLILSSFVQTTSPFFEGEVVYANTYKSKDPKITDKRLAAMLGSVHNYFIKGGNYKTVTNGNFAMWQLYINADNKIYNKISPVDTVFWNDGAHYDDAVISAKTNKNVTTILGYACDELILTCQSGVQKYYYSPKLKIDAALYKKHAYANFYNYVSRANAIPLKMIIEDDGFVIESIATAVTPKKLDPKLFTLPLNTKTKKSEF